MSTQDTITGHLHTWGIWERMVPELIGDDEASQRALTIHFDRYATVSRFVKGKRVLDIASGTGFGCKSLADAGAEKVVGVDIDENSIAYARKHNPADNIFYVQGDAEHFEADHPFDVITTFETIEHLKNPDGFLNRLRKLIDPEGHLFLSVPLGETRHIDPYHTFIFDQEEVFKLIEGAGFRLQACRVEPWKISFSDISKMLKTRPQDVATLRQLLFTRRGRLVLWELIRKRCISWDWLLVHATPRQDEGAEPRNPLPQLD